MRQRSADEAWTRVGLTLAAWRGVILFGALAATTAACSASEPMPSDAAAEADTLSAPDEATLDVPVSDADAGLDGDADLDAQAHDHDAAEDVQRPVDAHVPGPACHAGDRNEWSGLVPNTTLAVSVCSTCSGSYVLASNVGDTAGSVTVNNGTRTVMATVAAHGTAATTTLADDPTDGTVTVCGTSGTHGCLPVAPQNQEYCNPFRAVAHLVPERIDQGVDYACSGPIYAMGPGTVDVYHNRDDSGWPGGTFMSYRLTAGPASGRVIFLAENIDLNRALHAGSVVYSGTVLGTQVDASPQSEIGWGVLNAGYTAEHACYVEGCATALGSNFNTLLMCLHAPSGIVEARGCCESAPGWPTDWCARLASWQ